MSWIQTYFLAQRFRPAIEPSFWQQADALTKDVDHKDIAFVALALQKDAYLWTGDKKLVTHLRKLGYHKALSTSELYARLGTE